jgi:hypothetical protein
VRDAHPTTGPLPFAIGQSKPFVTGPYLGGFIYVFPAAVAAGATVTIAPGFVPRGYFHLGCPTGSYPSPMQFGAAANRTAKNTVMTCQNAQPAGTVILLV